MNKKLALHLIATTLDREQLIDMAARGLQTLLPRVDETFRQMALLRQRLDDLRTQQDYREAISRYFPETLRVGDD